MGGKAVVDAGVAGDGLGGVFERWVHEEHGAGRGEGPGNLLRVAPVASVDETVVEVREMNCGRRR